MMPRVHKPAESIQELMERGNQGFGANPGNAAWYREGGVTAPGFWLSPCCATDYVAGIPFEFSAILVGETSLDLIAVVDTLGDSDPGPMRGRVEGLSRALDLADSRRPLTVILVGPPPGFAVSHALARVCRVLVVGTPTGASAENELIDALAVLLPLELSTEGNGPPDSWPGTREALLAAHPDAHTAAMFEASARGTGAVREALRELLAAPFHEEDEEEA